MLYLYGFLPPGASLAPPERGVLESSVTAMECGGAVAWVTAVPDAFSVDARAVGAHLQTLQAALVAGVTPLPARVGQTFRSADELCRAITEQSAAITQSLARVHGCCEMVLHLRLSTTTEDRSSAVKRAPGRAYLERLQRRESMTSRLGKLAVTIRDAIQTELGGLILADEIGVPTPRPRPTITIAHLVSLGTASEYRPRLGETLERSVERDEWTWTIQGPIPPFSFARWDSSAGVRRD